MPETMTITANTGSPSGTLTDCNLSVPALGYKKADLKITPSGSFDRIYLGINGAEKVNQYTTSTAVITFNNEDLINVSQLDIRFFLQKTSGGTFTGKLTCEVTLHN